MKYTKYILGLCLSAVLVLASCETTDLDLTDNPNALSPSQADASFFLNSIQVDFAFWVNTMGDRGGELTRINYMNGRNYNTIYSPDSWNGVWSSAYRGMLEDIRLMNLLADEAGLTYQRGMGKVFQAYILLTLVDYFGDIPYSEALQGAEGILNPVADSGQSVYSAAIATLDSAVADFNAGGSANNDFFYNGDASKWIKAANSIKKKALLNTGDYAGYNAITNYISSPSDDFQFNWGTSPATPDTRHPLYRSNYTSTGGGEYQSNWMMFNMINGHAGNTDPRINYYFYRQVGETPGFDSAENEEVLEELDEEKEEEEERKKRAYRLAALEASNAAQLLAEDTRISQMNQVSQNAVDRLYMPKTINGGVYTETVVLEDKNLPQNKDGLRNNLAQQLLHDKMIEMQYK